MLQRIQTVFLALVALCMVLVMVFPLWAKTGGTPTETLTLSALALVKTTADGSKQLITSYWYIAVISLLSAGLASFSISRYKNRALQLKLGTVNTLLMATVAGLNILFIKQAEASFLPDIKGGIGIGFYLVVLAFIFNFLSNRFILRDEKIVRSMDNFRS